MSYFLVHNSYCFPTLYSEQLYSETTTVLVTFTLFIFLYFLKMQGFFQYWHMPIFQSMLSQEAKRKKHQENCMQVLLKCLRMIFVFTRWTKFAGFGKRQFGWKLETCFICKQQPEVKKVQQSGGWNLSISWRGWSCKICRR